MGTEKQVQNTHATPIRKKQDPTAANRAVSNDTAKANVPEGSSEIETPYLTDVEQKSTTPVDTSTPAPADVPQPATTRMVGPGGKQRVGFDADGNPISYQRGNGDVVALPPGTRMTETGMTVDVDLELEGGGTDRQRKSFDFNTGERNVTNLSEQLRTQLADPESTPASALAAVTAGGKVEPWQIRELQKKFPGQVTQGEDGTLTLAEDRPRGPYDQKTDRISHTFDPKTGEQRENNLSEGLRAQLKDKELTPEQVLALGSNDGKAEKWQLDEVKKRFGRSSIDEDGNLSIRDYDDVIHSIDPKTGEPQRQDLRAEFRQRLSNGEITPAEAWKTSRENLTDSSYMAWEMGRMFRESKDPAMKEQLAKYALRTNLTKAYGHDWVGEAIDITTRQSEEGDEAALHSLARFSAQQANNEGGIHTSKEDAGYAQKVRDSLRKQLQENPERVANRLMIGEEMRGKYTQVDWDHMELLGEAKDALKSSNPHLAKKVEDRIQSSQQEFLKRIDKRGGGQGAYNAFAKAGDNERLKDFLAPHVLGGDTLLDPAVMRDAMDRTLAKAKEGDAAALAALGKFSQLRPSQFDQRDGTKGAFEGRDVLMNDATKALREQLEGGNAGGVVDALMGGEDSKRASWNQNPEALKLLGEATAALDSADPRVAKVKDAMMARLQERNEWRDGKVKMGGYNRSTTANQRERSEDLDQAVLEALLPMADRLTGEDMKWVGVSMAKSNTSSSGAASALYTRGLENFDIETQQVMARNTLDLMRENHNDHNDTTQEVRALQGQAFADKVTSLDRFLTGEDYAQIANGEWTKNSEALTDILTDGLASENTSAEAKQAAMAAILDTPRRFKQGIAGKDSGQLDKLVDYALESGDESTRKAVMGLLPSGPDITDSMTDIGNETMARIAKVALSQYERFGHDSKNSGNKAKLGQLFKARLLAGTPEFEGQVDVQKVDAAIADMIKNDPKLQDFVKGTSDAVVNSFRESEKGKALLKQQMDYLKSPQYQAKMRLMNPEERQEELKQDSLKVAALNPESMKEARDLMASSMLQTAADRPLDGLRDMPAQKQEEHLTNYLSGVLGNVAKESPGQVKALVKELLEKGSTATGAEIESLAARKFPDLVGKLKATKAGLHGFGAGMGVYNALSTLRKNGDPDSAFEAMELGKAVTGALNDGVGLT